MKRQDKYPDTKTFHYYNANPKNRITGDCTVRAIATATGIPYNEVVQGMTDIYIKTGYVWNDTKGESKYLESIGWVKQKQPRKPDGTKYTGREWCEIIQRKIREPNGKRYRKIIAHIGGHHIVAIVDGVVNDIWNSTGGCIGNYYIK